MLMMALLIWCALSVPVAVAVGRILAGPGGNPPGPPLLRQLARNHQLVRN